MEIYNEYTAYMLQKARQQEMLSQAENQRLVASLRREVLRPIRRALRINNDPVR